MSAAPRFACSLVVGAVLAGTSCTDDRVPPASITDFARLVPEDAVCVLRAYSLRELEAVVSNADVPRGSGPVTTFLSQATSIDPLRFDLDSPWGLALSVGASEAGRVPAATLILPMTAPRAVAKTLGRRATRAGCYVAVSIGPTRPRSGPNFEMALGLPDGDIAVRLDVDRLERHYGALVHEWVSKHASRAAAAVKSVLTSVDRIAVTCNLSPTSLDVSTRIDLEHDSELARFRHHDGAQLVDLAKHAPARHADSLVLSALDGALLTRWLVAAAALIGELPSPTTADMSARVLHAFAGRDEPFVLGTARRGAGPSAFAVTAEENGAATRCLADAGIELEAAAQRTVAGLRFSRSRVRPRATGVVPAVWHTGGPESVFVAEATRGHRVLLITHQSDQDLEAAARCLDRGGQLPPAVVRAIDTSHGNLLLLAWYGPARGGGGRSAASGLLRLTAVGNAWQLTLHSDTRSLVGQLGR